MEKRNRMKILIAYDGSDGAESAIDDLERAGLPERAEAVVLTVVEEWVPAPTSIGGVETTFAEDLLTKENDAIELAGRARARVQKLFPQWDVIVEPVLGTPGGEIIAYASKWRPDLIVVGTHSRTTLGRMFLGGVSQRVIHEARCSARVARGRVVEPNVPARIVIGVDGSKGARAAVAEVASRNWPAGSEVRLVNSSSALSFESDPEIALRLEEWFARERELAKKALDAATEELASAGLNVSVVVNELEPKDLLCSEAAHMRADCIFVGARGLGRFERFVLGSVSSEVAARAHCSVEVVRTADEAPDKQD
jgi:nucleotide-binding universal stress UspA family protein